MPTSSFPVIAIDDKSAKVTPPTVINRVPFESARRESLECSLKNVRDKAIFYTVGEALAYIGQRSGPFIVLVHASNHDLGIDNDEGECYLDALRRIVIEREARLVFFTGGYEFAANMENPVKNRLNSWLARAIRSNNDGSFEYGIHWTYIEGGSLHLKLKSLKVPIELDPDYRVEDLLPIDTVPVWERLLPLQILLQKVLDFYKTPTFTSMVSSRKPGTVATVAGHAGRCFDADNAHLLRDYQINGAPTIWDREHIQSPEYSGYFWFDSVLPLIEECRFDDLVRIDVRLKGCAHLGRFWKLLRQKCLGLDLEDQTCPETPTKILNLMEESYWDIMKLRGPALLADIRATLSHDLFKNSFVEKIGFYADRSAERDSFIEDVWSGETGKVNEDEYLAAKRASVDAARANWVMISNGLQDFLGDIPAKFGYQWTHSATTLLSKIDGESGTLNTISRFVREFDEIGTMSVDSRRRELDVFWLAVTRTQEVLHALRFTGDEDHNFWKYLEPASKART